MTVKVTMPNNSSDSVDFINATGTTLAQVKAYDDGSSNGHLELYTTASGTSTERVRVTSAGNVGIGTGSPTVYGSYKTLEVRGTGGGLLQIGTGASTAAYLFQDGTNAGFNNIANGVITLGTNNTERARIDTSGNLLVGTTSGAAVGGGVVLTQAGYSMTAGQGIGFNIGYNGGFKYVGNGYGLLINQTNGDTVFQRAANNSSGAGAAATLTESMRIDSSGNLLVGTTSTSPNPGVSIAGAGSIAIGNNAAGAGYTFQYFLRSAGIIGSIVQNGTTAVAYNTTSDYRLKENVQPLTGALSRIAALKPCTYTWKSAPDEVGEGFIAHELAEVCPQAVTGEKDAVDENGNPVHQQIDTSFLVATLTAAIQELSAKNDALEARLAALENK